jgi:hypothetical protein
MKKIKDWDWESIIFTVMMTIMILLLIFYFHVLVKCSNDPNSKICGEMAPTQSSQPTQPPQDNGDGSGVDFKCVYIFGSGFKCGFMID